MEQEISNPGPVSGGSGYVLLCGETGETIKGSGKEIWVQRIGCHACPEGYPGIRLERQEEKRQIGSLVLAGASTTSREFPGDSPVFTRRAFHKIPKLF